MENGRSNLADKFSALSFNDKNNDGLFQVMKAVEAAEVTIKQQVEENNRLRDELLKKNHELEKYKVDGLKVQSPNPVDNWDVHSNGLIGTHLSVLTNQADRAIGINNSYERDPAGTLGLREVVKQNVKDQTYGESHSKSNKMNGPTNAFPGGQTALDNAGFSQYLSASTSLSPGRYQTEGEYTSQFIRSNGQGLMSITNVNPKNPLKQDLVVKTQEHEEEILQLRKHLTEYSIKEAQLRNEKYVLEKRIAYLRMAFDQQQQELVDAANKAITYRQDIIEENIRLSYALQEAQQERSTYVSSLMPILAEYSFQPPVADAQSIVSNLKVIFKHLQEKLIITETKLKESHYQMTLWNSDMNPTNFTQSPSHLLGPKGLELVPQPTYSNGHLSVFSDPIKTRDWDVLGSHQNVGGNVPNNLETDDLGRNTVSQGTHVQDAVSQGDSRPNNSASTSKQVKFSDAVSSIETDPEMEGGQIDSDPSNWDSKSPYTTDDPSSSYSPYLPPVLEEPSSSFSEAADDDPLPAVEGLQISGEAFPGRELQASGYSINGTTSCNFEWVRHLEDGSVNYIDGAKQPNYLVSADDIDTYLAIEVQPMDDRKRKGELVKVFANEHRKISCDPEMHNHIKKILSIGHASYTVYHSVGYLDMWERASLVIKREGFSIKGTETGTSLVTEKFSPATTVIIPCGNPTDFSIISGATECLLRAENNLSDIACSRDTIVLTLRLFVIRAGEKKKGKKKGLFFNK